MIILTYDLIDRNDFTIAHELGHYTHKDIWRSLTFGIISTFVAFWIVFQVMNPLSIWFGYQGVSDIAAMPVLFLVFYFFNLILMPIQHGFSRWMERRADDFALELCPNLSHFVSCMNKLAEVNLADRSPNPVYEWFFYDHPSIEKRIRRAHNRYA